MRGLALTLASVLVSGCVVSVTGEGGNRGGTGGSAGSRGGSGGNGSGGAPRSTGGTPSSSDAGEASVPTAQSDAGDAGAAEAAIASESGVVDAAGEASPVCEPTADSDTDGDGFTVADGDCDDCNEDVNPGAYDFPGDDVDQDCSGTADDEPENCDGSLPLDSANALNGARAIGLCKTASLDGQGWGVISARYVLADGSAGMNPVSHGLLPGFGDNIAPREGTSLLALSSGTARRPDDPGYRDVSGADMETSSDTPAGFPIDSPSCSVTTADVQIANDSAALEITIRAPSNVEGFEFSFNFYTFEYPTYVCSEFNDFFVALQSPAPPSSIFGNISFDNPGNPVSVNNAFLEVCNPGTHGGKTFTCPQGTEELAGTGFDGSAATGWLLTRSPMTPGAVFTLRFAAWDAGDHILDSTVLIDRFRWTVDGPLTPTTTRM